MVAGLIVDVVHLTGLHTSGTGALGEQHRRKDEFLLRRQRTNDGSDLVRFDLGLCRSNVADGHRAGAFMLRLFCRDAEQIQRATGIAMLLRGKGGAQANHAVFQGLWMEGARGALNEDVAELIRIVGVEHDVLLTEAGPDTRIEEIRELQVV
jgi:hypothetical protein